MSFSTLAGMTQHGFPWGASAGRCQRPRMARPRTYQPRMTVAGCRLTMARRWTTTPTSPPKIAPHSADPSGDEIEFVGLLDAEPIPCRDELELASTKHTADGRSATPLERTPGARRRETSRAPAPTRRPHQEPSAAMPNQRLSHGGYRVPVADERYPLSRAR